MDSPPRPRRTAHARVPTEPLMERPSWTASPEPVEGVSRGMSDRMRAIEALSTVEPLEPVESSDSGAYAGESFAELHRPTLAPIQIGLASAVLSALVVAAIHFFVAERAPSPATAIEKRPAPVVHTAAAFNEAAPSEPTAELITDRERARKLALMGRRALEQGRPATAQRMFARALEAHPSCRIALEGMGRHALTNREYSAAIQYFRHAVRVEPRNADNRRLLADAYAAQGRTDRAQKQYQRAAELGDTTAARRLSELPPHAGDTFVGL